MLKDVYLGNFINVYLFSLTSLKLFHDTKHVLNAGIISKSMQHVIACSSPYSYVLPCNP